jgi:hypothetical protein
MQVPRTIAIVARVSRHSSPLPQVGKRSFYLMVAWLPPYAKTRESNSRASPPTRRSAFQDGYSSRTRLTLHPLQTLLRHPLPPESESADIELSGIPDFAPKGEKPAATRFPSQIRLDLLHFGEAEPLNCDRGRCRINITR